MCKPKPQLVDSVWSRTDYVAYRFDYYSIGRAKDEIAGEVQAHFPKSLFTCHPLRDEDRKIVSIDNLAYNLKLSIDEVNNETVYHFVCAGEDSSFQYEIYIGRYFTQVIYRKNQITDARKPLFLDVVFLLEFMLRSEKLNIEKMTCVVHTIEEYTFENMLKIVEPVTLSELRDNKVSQSRYSDTREVGDMKLESKRIINRSKEEHCKIEVIGVSYYQRLTAANFMQSYHPLMDNALLENTTYFIA
jgi:hypothetical protein